MPFPFVLPTIGSSPLTQYLASSTHPSLPFTATTHRSVLRDALKKHKRLPTASQASNLPTVQDALNNYIPYLLLLDAAVDKQPIHGERVDMQETRPLELEWRPTLSRSSAGRGEPERVKITRIRDELAFVLQTLAYVQVLQARSLLFSLYAASPPPSQEHRAGAIATAMKFLLDANSIHSYSLSLAAALLQPVPQVAHTSASPVTSPSPSVTPSAPADILPSTQSALASLALAEATLITVSKDDPYAAAVVEARNKESKEWMIRAPSIPKVRAHLFARLCLASADHAAKASALLAQAGARLDDSLLKYTDDFKRTARAKAARFLGIDAEIAGKTGEAIAWMRGGRKELGFITSSAEEAESGKRRGLKGLKQSWAEKREDRIISRGNVESWGLDAGKLEEGRVLEWLEGKWNRENDTVSVQIVAPFEPLLAAMPSGREYHTLKTYTPPALDGHVLASMRAPPDPAQHAYTATEADSGDEADYPPVEPVGAFPGTGTEYRTDSPAYY
ncbi:hypothetical protein AAFC00_007303 [Neodothiora populina]|uniref:pH-response regulator protein palC n=1 Tax=Neodothiora populina TaxID=2781224 RepID=A0ABR3PHU1_9PEZI